MLLPHWLDFSPAETLLFPGTFSPFHAGHLAMITAAQAQFSNILIIPSGPSPHRQHDAGVVSPQHRLQMAWLATRHLSGVWLSDCETQQMRTTYTVDTIQRFQAYSQHTPGFRGRTPVLIGADAFMTLPQWKHWETLCQKVRWIVVPRQDQILRIDPSIVFDMLPMPLHPASATAIRTLQPSAQPWVSPLVTQYRKNNGIG